MKHFDVVVLGAGSAGELIATTLARAGRSVALIEKLRVGGECAYVSCMPSKAMLRSAQIRELAKETVSLGATSTPLVLDDEIKAFHGAVARRDRVAEFRDDSAASAAAIKDGVQLYRGNGVITGPNSISINQEELRWIDLVIATGSVPTIPKIEGLETISAWTSEDALSAGDRPSSVLIVGGGRAGVSEDGAARGYAELLLCRPRSQGACATGPVPCNPAPPTSWAWSLATSADGLRRQPLDAR